MTVDDTEILIIIQFQFHNNYQNQNQNLNLVFETKHFCLVNVRKINIIIYKLILL